MRWSQYFFCSSFLFLACFAQEGVAGAAESLQTKHWTCSTAGRADPAASGSQYGYAKSPENSGRCPHSWNHLVSESMQDSFPPLFKCIFTNTTLCSNVVFRQCSGAMCCSPEQIGVARWSATKWQMAHSVAWHLHCAIPGVYFSSLPWGETARILDTRLLPNRKAQCCTIL